MFPLLIFLKILLVLSNDTNPYDITCDRNDPACNAFKLIPNTNPSGLSCNSNSSGSKLPEIPEYKFECTYTKSNRCTTKASP